MAAPVVAAPAATAVASGGTKAAALAFLNDLLAGLVAAGITSAAEPERRAEPPLDTSGKFFIGPEAEIRAIQDYRGDLFRTKIANLFGFDLPAPTTPRELISQAEERLMRQGRDLTEREIAKRSVELANELARERLQRDAEIRRAQIEATGGLRRQEVMSAADVRRGELEALGRTQAERLRSSYGMAGDVLQNAIENVLKSGVINDRSVQVELAKIQ
jgi:hypothetical protein